MTNKLYVSNLAFAMTDQQLADTFSKVGTVQSAKVIFDGRTNRSKGFGFVEMSNEQEAKKAINELNNTDVAGRSIKVDEARSLEARPSGGRPSGDRDRGGFAPRRNFGDRNDRGGDRGGRGNDRGDRGGYGRSR